MFKPAYRHERRVLVSVQEPATSVGILHVGMHMSVIDAAEQKQVLRGVVAVPPEQPMVEVGADTRAARKPQFATTSGAVVHNPTRLRQLIRLAGRRLR
jgi:hypothetical protein